MVRVRGSAVQAVLAARAGYSCCVSVIVRLYQVLVIIITCNSN